MLPGIDGHLLSGAFIEQQVPAHQESADAARVRREMAAWRRGSAWFGPASSPRAILQSAAPFFTALGFEAAGSIEAAEPCVAATLRSALQPVALLVTPWGEAGGPFWRPAVTQAMNRSASWCLVFDGLRLRSVDAGRLYARRHLEIDLDMALDDPRVFAVLLQLFGASALGAGAEDQRSLHALVVASDRHAAGVCRSLRDGVLAASSEILRALAADRVRPKPATTHADADHGTRSARPCPAPAGPSPSTTASIRR